ncbi:TonB family protein [bacterium]|nr:TonB family protein [bacterium]
MQNRESWTGYESKVRKKSFFLSLTIHFIGITFLTVSSINIVHKNEVFVVQLLNIPSIPEVKEKVLEKPKVDKKKIESKVENKEKIKQDEIPSFNIDKYRNELLSKIEVKSSKLAKNEKVNIGKINIPSLHSTSLSLKNVNFLPDIPSWYISLLKSRIEENWKFKNIIGELSALISFRIYRSGKITDLKIEKSSGYSPFDRSAVLAVKSTKDIPPFPEEIKQSYLDVMIEFKKED